MQIGFRHLTLCSALARARYSIITGWTIGFLYILNQKAKADRPPKHLLAGGRLCVVYDALLGLCMMRRVRS